MTYLESLLKMYFAWRQTKHDRWDLPHSWSTLRNKGTSHTTIEMVVHHHRPSMTLTRARQLRSFWSRLDSQTQKREVIKTRVEKKLRLNLITMEERKNTYISVTLSTSITLILSWNCSSISVTLKNKNLHLKEKEKPKLNLYKNLVYSLLDRPFCLWFCRYL